MTFDRMVGIAVPERRKCEACGHPDDLHFQDGYGNVICRYAVDCPCVHRIESFTSGEVNHGGK